MGLEGLVGPEGGAPSQVSDPETKPKVHGSGIGKQERSGSGEDDWRNSKMARTDDFSVSKTMPVHQSTPLLRSNSTLSDDGRPQQQMLSFSSVKSEGPSLGKNGGLVERSTQAFPFYQHTPAAYYRNAGTWCFVLGYSNFCFVSFYYYYFWSNWYVDFV